jgi:glycosyltransferase involved in cell wall biosynthesis
MQTLVITATEPPMPGRDVHAVYRRLGLFLAAIGEISEQIAILHFAQPGNWALTKSPIELNEMQSAYWGRRVSASLVTADPFDASWLGYVRSVFSVSHQGRFSAFGGESQVAAVRSSLLGGPQLIFVHRLEAMIPVLQIEQDLAPIVFDLDDIAHWMVLRAALEKPGSPREIRRLLQAPAILAAEYRAAKLARKTFVCSELDKRYLRRLSFEGITCIPNAIDLPSAFVPPTPEPTILFLGGYQYQPNADAADRLITRIWPKIRAAIPAARLVVAGNLPQLIKSFASAPAGVEFPGIVQDLELLYRETRVVCCPITRGGGTRVKLIEAAAHAKPIVSTTVGAEGLALRNEVDVLIRDDDNSIADACLQLLADSDRCQILGRGAFDAARRHYDAKQIRLLIKDQLLDAIAQDRPLS